MAEPTIVFRLRFAVALGVALGLLLLSCPRDAWGAEYIVQMDAGSAPSEGAALAERLGGRVTSPELDVINGFGASLGRAAAARLEASDSVRAVTPNAGVMTSSHRTREDTSGGYRCPGTDATTTSDLPAQGYARAGRRRSWDRLPPGLLHRLQQPLHQSAGVDRAWLRTTGRGVGVAVIDTGIAGYLPDFRAGDPAAGSRVIASAVTNPCASDANDHFGHGTHVAGLIAGNPLHQADGSRSRYMGISPDANLISVKTSDDDGDATILDVIHGLQFAVDHRDELGIRVINLSLSSSVAESYLTDPLDAAVESAWFSGLVVVAAAGNEGTRRSAVAYAPGNDPYVITAGAIDDRGTWRTSDDVLASWSSRGVTQDGVRKPEVLAPGVRLVAALAPGSDFVDLCDDCAVDGRYFRVSGTSMAAAVVSGVAALMLEEHPDWSPDQVKGAMVATLANAPAVGGVVDAAAALDGSGVANAGLVPSTLVSPQTGEIDWARASFRRASFRSASGSPYVASWSRASFRCDCSLLESGEVDPNRSSFRAAGFSRTTELEAEED
jgi:serine protease AprX